VRSDLTGGNYIGASGIQSNPGMAFAGDIAFYYQKDLLLSDYDSRMAFGVNISNMGNKDILYRKPGKAFIPINLRLGGAFTTWFDEYNSVTLTLTE